MSPSNSFLPTKCFGGVLLDARQVGVVDREESFHFGQFQFLSYEGVEQRCV
jgi:hypothetical protein